MQKLVTFFRTLGPVRGGVLAATLAVLIGGFSWLLAEANASRYALLFGGLDSADAARTVAQLESAKIPYQLGRDGSSVLVPEETVTRTRLMLAEQGMPSGGVIGYEIFDRSDALGNSNFVQNVNMVRALEGELARTIRAIDTVKAARVHLVLPQRELFSREKQRPSASVLLQMKGSGRISQAQTVAVQRLIASAVPGLAPDNVSIVDGQGTLLSRDGGKGDGEATFAVESEERRTQLQQRLARTIEELLERTVGPGKVRAEVSAEMDFDRINSSEEIYNPDGQVARSTQSVKEHSASTDGDAAPPVTVSGSLPGASTSGTGGPSSASNENRNEETVNYEISKKVVNHVREAGAIKRLSVAVLVDGVWITGADGARAYQPRPQDELDRLSSLARSAVGFSADRGDAFQLINMPFAEQDVPVAAEMLPFGLEKRDLFSMASYLGLFLFAVLAMLVVVRPLLNRGTRALLSSPGPLAIAADGGRQTLIGADGGQPSAQALQIEDQSGDESMVDVARVRGRVRASSLKRVSDIVGSHPDESLAIIRTWLYAENEG